MRMMPMAASIPLITLLGHIVANDAEFGNTHDQLEYAGENHGKEKASGAGSFNTAAATIAVRPAAGPLTLRWLPLISPTTTPPTTPPIMPENSFKPLATAIPKHREWPPGTPQ